MTHILYIGILLGWGAAIPFGPINFEIIRRNLNFGTKIGILFGFGACSADLLYLVLLSLGTLSMIANTFVLKSAGLLGSIILAIFGYSSMRKINTEHHLVLTDNASFSYKHYLSGLLLTLLNPFTFIFWLSISSQIVMLAKTQMHAITLAGLGVLIGTASWQVSLNMFFHFARNSLTISIINILNKLGGVILLSFSAYFAYHSLM